MSFIAFHGERRIADVVTRAYGKLKPADAKRAATALLAANPQLDRLDLLDRGRPIAVPPVSGFPARKTERSAPLAEGVDGLRASVAAFLKQLSDDDRLEQQEIEQTRALLESDDDLRRIVEGNEGAGELIERINEALTEREADLERRSAFVKRLRRADRELAALAKSMR